ncbi:MAG: hypothetical protein CMG63_02665 [Candidatus Marinimicrobia bacterium]|nr:hypothetical protein [Candidatus Neomarinimicrobiota bacterium]|tara:strand:+ start:1412 stop:1756 length:345 start_codon:yes stop_codon:yes gene_type:complete
MKIKEFVFTLFFSTFMIGCNNTSEEMVINTPTIQCGMCQKIIEVGLAKIDGVSNPRVDLKTKKTILFHDPEKTNLKSIEKVVSELGYQANKLKANPDSYADLPACCKIGGMDKI